MGDSFQSDLGVNPTEPTMGQHRGLFSFQLISITRHTVDHLIGQHNTTPLFRAADRPKWAVFLCNRLDGVAGMAGLLYDTL